MLVPNHRFWKNDEAVQLLQVSSGSIASSPGSVVSRRKKLTNVRGFATKLLHRLVVLSRRELQLSFFHFDWRWSHPAGLYWILYTSVRFWIPLTIPTVFSRQVKLGPEGLRLVMSVHSANIQPASPENCFRLVAVFFRIMPWRQRHCSRRLCRIMEASGKFEPCAHSLGPFKWLP